MKLTTKQWAGYSILSLIILLALAWIFQGADFFMYKFFAPRQEAVRRQVFEETKSYNQGMLQELQNMQFEYVKATSSQQQALATIILHRSADFPLDKMPADLRAFIQGLRARAGSN